MLAFLVSLRQWWKNLEVYKGTHTGSSYVLLGNQEYVIGRMIHLDTDAQVGVPFANAVLNHIDLAYNLYINEGATTRLSQELCSGNPVQNATRRTHILRIEDIPFSSLFKIAQSFFKSVLGAAEH